MTQSPFPGMDPWLERYWGDVHHRLINYSCDAIEEALPPGLVARMEERVYLEFEEGGRQRRIPDVVLLEQTNKRPSPPHASSAALEIAQPLRLRVESEEATEGFVQIIDVENGGRVLTVIEVLSPANKRPGPGQRMYLDKQRELRESGISLVEIDLLRAGERVINARPEMLPDDYRTAYQACVRRGSSPDIIEVYRIPLRQRLPAVWIPLRQEDGDFALDLQKLIEQTYRKGRYGSVINYQARPDPPLSPEDAAWADAHLASMGLRS